jgi:hypothetical protein
MRRAVRHSKADAAVTRLTMQQNIRRQSWPVHTGNRKLGLFAWQTLFAEQEYFRPSTYHDPSAGLAELLGCLVLHPPDLESAYQFAQRSICLS